METINVGIFGHIDHGKTTLLEKLTGKWADTHSEELKRGITIKLGYADTVIYKDKDDFNITKRGQPVKHVSFIDAPGHEMLMATTLSGAALIDAALLVIAANEGIKPQTYEHLLTLKAKKVSQLIVIQNKIDLVSKEQAKKNYQEIKSFLKDQPYQEIIPVSAQQGVNINEVLKAIASLSITKKDISSKPLFLIARSFDVNRPGTAPKNLNGAVLGGSLKKGTLRVGDEIEIKPGRVVKENNQTTYIPLTTKISGLFKGSNAVKELTPGGSMSIATELDMSLAKSDKLAGNLASTAGCLPEPSTKIKISHTLFPKVFGISSQLNVEPIKQGETLMLSINTSITGGDVTYTNKEIEIELKVPAVFFRGDNVGIARNIQGHWRLIGYGEIL